MSTQINLQHVFKNSVRATCCVNKCDNRALFNAVPSI